MIFRIFINYNAMNAYYFKMAILRIFIYKRNTLLILKNMHRNIDVIYFFIIIEDWTCNGNIYLF